MYLKSIRIRGFKSFPGSVELTFHQGIAVIVGPNGSGKSNVADALQWAMATQAPAQLRAPSGQDVLFSGSDSPAAGRRVRGRARAGQLVRHAAARVRRGVGHAAAHPRGRRRVLHQPGQGAPARPARAAGRYRPRPRDALGHRPGEGRGDPALQAPRAAPVRGGGRGPRQVPAAPGTGRDQDGARVRRARAGARPRARGQGAAAAARDAGHRGRQGGQAGR